MTTQKETLQLKDIAGYIANGDLKAITVETNRIVNFLIKDTELLCGANDIYKPLLYPLSHLTKEMPFNGGTIVPLIECAKVAFPLVNDFRFKHNFVKSDKAMISFYYEPAINSFLAFEPSMQDIKVPKQHALFQLLYQYKIDFLGFIDKGLAVDVSTLTVNPYL